MFCLACASFASGENDFEAMQRKMEELARKIGETNDPAELIKIQQELTELTAQMLNQLPKWDPGIVESQGRTPEDEVDRRIEAINRIYRVASKSVYQLTDQTKPLVPLEYASRIRGRIVVTGKDTELFSKDWVWVDLNYKVQEKFVGYLIVTEYYDPRTRRIADQKDYAIHSISTDIKRISQTGKQCIGLTSYIPKNCTGYEEFTDYDTHREDVYPALHDWVIMGSSEGDSLSIKVESPSIYFRSANGSVGRALGCYGTKFEIPKSDFERDLQNIDELYASKDVGHKSSGSPRCDPGSAIELRVKPCDPKQYVLKDKCKQLESLLADIKALIRLRNAFKEMADRAKDEDDLMELVVREMTRIYPDKDWKKSYEEDSGGYDFRSGEIILPEFCNDCTPRPLCEWHLNGLEIHEQTHQTVDTQLFSKLPKNRY